MRRFGVLSEVAGGSSRFLQIAGGSSRFLQVAGDFAVGASPLTKFRNTQIIASSLGEHRCV